MKAALVGAETLRGEEIRERLSDLAISHFLSGEGEEAILTTAGGEGIVLRPLEEEELAAFALILDASEEPVKPLVRRALVFARDVRAGETVGIGDLVATRCGGGVYPAQIEAVVGRRVCSDQAAGTPVCPHVLA